MKMKLSNKIWIFNIKLDYVIRDFFIKISLLFFVVYMTPFPVTSLYIKPRDIIPSKKLPYIHIFCYCLYNLLFPDVLNIFSESLFYIGNMSRYHIWDSVMETGWVSLLRQDSRVRVSLFFFHIITVMSGSELERDSCLHHNRAY